MDPTVIGAIIGAAALVATTFLSHYLSRRHAVQTPAAVGKPLTLTDATALIVAKATALHLATVGEVKRLPPSAFGTAAFCAYASDGKGALYCHGSGEHMTNVFHVRGGIGWYYNYEMRGPGSFLGLPLSDEEPVQEGQRSVFEGGVIVWSRTEDKLRVYDTRAAGVAKLVADHQF